MDKYEASVWRVPDPRAANKGLVKKIQQGKATLADLTKSGATQLGITADDYAPCLDSGQNCIDDVYALSIAGAFDMVGNLREWVADWVPRSSNCGTWTVDLSPTGDEQCLTGALTTGEPGAMLRGGNFVDLATAGPLAIQVMQPSIEFGGVGFRCAR